VKEETEIPQEHPRAKSLQIRERLVRHYRSGVVAEAGLFAHGRGEAFDYLLGEKTTENALKALEAAAAALLTAKRPVISVNGNAAALAARDIVKLAEVTGAKIEVNLFYCSAEREIAIKKLLTDAGAKQVLGVGEAASARISEIGSERRRVDPEGILVADVVLVPLEDGDRTEALVKMGKKVIAIDLNPLSRTAQFATITIVDNIVRAMPVLVEFAEKLKEKARNKLETILADFSNKKNLGDAIDLINQRLSKLAEKGTYISVSPKGEK
jgi:4-phosphopantoate--beta-alanine ligase